MTEGYKPRMGWDDREFAAPPRELRPAERDELVQAVEYSMKFSRGKPITAARDLAVAALANMVVEHLELSGYVVMKGPPRAAHSTGSEPGR